MSYPLTALGAILIGILESFASFWSSTLKEVIVFATLIPILLWRSLLAGHAPRGRRGGDRVMGIALTAVILASGQRPLAAACRQRMARGTHLRPVVAHMASAQRSDDRVEVAR